MHFNGEARHEWPEFATSFLALGADEGGWEQALEMQLDLQVAANKRLNKMAWCYLTLMLEGSALDEMDVVSDKNAYAVWQHLKGTYEPKGRKANDYHKMKFEQCKLESPEEINDFLEKEVMDADADGKEEKEAFAINGNNMGDGVKVDRKETESSREEGNQCFKCHDNKDKQHGMEKVIVKNSDQMVVMNGMMGKEKQQTIMEDAMSQEVMLQSQDKSQIEQQAGRHGKKHQEDNTYGIDLWKKNIEADERKIDAKDPDEEEESTREEEPMEDIKVESEWESDEAVQEKHGSLVEGREDKSTREESNKKPERLSVELREINTEPSGDDKNVQEDHQEFTVEPREHEHVGVKDGFETIQVEMKEDGKECLHGEEEVRNHDVKDGEECLFGEEEVRNHGVKGGEKCLNGDPEVWMEDENIFAVYLLHGKKRHYIKRSKVRETHGERKDQPMSGELESQHVPKIVREAVSRFKEKANE